MFAHAICDAAAGRRCRAGRLDLGQRRAEPDVEQHRTRSADGCRRAGDDTALSTVMACSTSMIGAIEAAGMINGTSRRLALVGGVESMSRVQIGLGQTLSDWLRQFQKAKSIGDKLSAIAKLTLGDVKPYIPAVTNRARKSVV